VALDLEPVRRIVAQSADPDLSSARANATKHTTLADAIAAARVIDGLPRGYLAWRSCRIETADFDERTHLVIE
jgi:hypothetical protein